MCQTGLTLNSGLTLKTGINIAGKTGGLIRSYISIANINKILHGKYETRLYSVEKAYTGMSYDQS
ncbi:hypothetical protein RYU24_17490 [Acinetobacter variabilis]|nr:hypothetical protein RYU24_17490 [Acinetobacter variabilis]